MVLGYPAKAGRQFVLHAKTRIGRQDDFSILVAQLTITEAAVVTRDAVLAAGNVRTLVLGNRGRGVESDRVPNRLCTALPHLVRKREGASEIRSEHLEATIGSAAARKAQIMQKHRH